MAGRGRIRAWFAGANLVHRVGWKYLSRLNRFNGGMWRIPPMCPSPGQMRSRRRGLEASGFELPPGDSGVYLGRNPA